MLQRGTIDPVDYLLIGHITRDLIPGGHTMGGTASYAARAAQAMGMRVGIVTAYPDMEDLAVLEGIQVVSAHTDTTTVFENIQTPAGRIQFLHERAPELTLSDVPQEWRNTPIVHLGPVAGEVHPQLAQAFQHVTLGATPQGWMRGWDANGLVHFSEWPEAGYVLGFCQAAVMSIEDIQADEGLVEQFASQVRILAVTEGAQGARIFWNGDVRRFRPPKMVEIDPTGAGDIFAAAFFIRLHATHNPWEAARFATQLAAYSVQRRGLEGIPTRDEIHQTMFEVLDGNPE